MKKANTEVPRIDRERLASERNKTVMVGFRLREDLHAALKKAADEVYNKSLQKLFEDVVEQLISTGDCK